MSDSRSGRGRPLLALMTICGAMAIGLVLRAQIPAVNHDIRAAKGLVVSPTYEGWYQLDGTTYALFGYYNRNTEEVIDVPIGPNNRVEPGPIDQGQPTHFVPGQHYGVFAVPVPKDRPKTEIVWTLTANGQTLSIPATLDQLYFVFPQRDDGGVRPGNTPPVLKFEPTGSSAQGPIGLAISRTATVSRPLALDVWVTDTEAGTTPRGQRGAPTIVTSASAQSRPPTVTWSVYRGPDRVSFSNLTPPLEQGKAHTTATFSEPGDYTLRVLAFESRSGTKCCWTNGYVKVAVEGGVNGR